MSINAIKVDFKGIGEISKPQEVIKSDKAGQTSFGEMFTNALQEVDHLQKDADKKIESVTLGKGGVQSHDAMLALEKADLAFQLMSQIRAKIVRAYEEVLRTQV